MNRSTSSLGSLSDILNRIKHRKRIPSDEYIGFVNNVNSDFDVSRPNRKFRRVLNKDEKLKLLQRLSMKKIVKNTSSRLKGRKSKECTGDSYLSAGNYELAKKFYMKELQSEIANERADNNTLVIANLMSGIGLSTTILDNNPYIGLAWLTDAKNVILQKSDVDYDDWTEIANIFEDMAFISFIGHDKTNACQYLIEAIRIKRLLDDKYLNEEDFENDDTFLTEDNNDPSIPRMQYMMEIVLESRKREINIMELVDGNSSALGLRFPKILHMLCFLGKMYRNNDGIIALLYFEEALKLIRAANLLDHPCAKEVFKNILEIENKGSVMRFKPSYVKLAN